MLPRVLSVALVLAGALVAGQIVFPKNEDPSQAAAGGAAGGNPTRVINSQGPSVDGRQGNANIFFPKSEEQEQILCITYKNEPGNCRLLAQCTTFFAEIAELSRSPCTINGEQQGVCCPPTKQATTDIGVLISKQPTPLDEPVPSLEVRQLNHACEMGISQITAKEAFEEELLKNNIVAEKGSPVALHAQLFQTTDKIVKKSKEAEMNVAASVNLVKQFNLTKSQGGFGLPRFGVQNTIIANTCPQEPLCPDTKYRAFDGTCNNRRNKEWGKAGTAFQRILPPDYHDGVNMPRQFSVTGSLLPSPRSISSRVIVDRDSRYDNFTILIMQWGQFLDHDITHTPITKGKDKSDITCCKRGQRREPRELHPDCLPIEIPDTDTFFSQFGQRCMEFVRSMPAVRPKCNFGPREQMNQITSFIDASNVYGSTEEEAKPLRSFVDGKLKVKTQNGNDLLPPHREECTDASRQFHCFKAGDSRVNEQPELAVMHTVWMRQHNRLAEGLKKLNPGWDDEVLYQEARRIVAAQMQHITYNEYLPIVLGREFMEVFGLVPKESGYASNYREDIDPSINNAFATAAFRYGHTLIHGTMEGYSKFGTIDRNLRLSEHQFSPFVLYQRDGVDSLLRGLSIQASQKFDHFFSEEVGALHLNCRSSDFNDSIMDLIACSPPCSPWQVINQLRSLYLHVDDIDLFIGGIAEKPSAGSLLGHTFLCIVGDQFARLRLGDRFYYENGGLESSFSELQLQEIRKTTLSRIMCDNSNLDMMQPLAFVDAHLANKRAVCKFGTLIPEMSLEPWRNEPVWV
ncbi:chorion peroxidase-like [Penaeus monodon]|uniref:chorion peroxidase-like n=1 Tax=Penaeus monodon TaxID=6687 RepID=UPI0018A6F348|nr:chorion peroxidase-like [Penaeus monodon]